MKFVAIALVLVLVLDARGDAGKKQKTPTVVYYQDSPNPPIPLEAQVAYVKHKYRAWGFEGGTTVFFVAGEKSPIRLAAKPKLEFVVQLESGTDPLETVQFYHFDRINGSRVMPIGDFNAFGQLSNLTISARSIDFNASKQVDGSFKLIPIQVLIPGEYCLFVKVAKPWPNKAPGNCFGVDPGVQNESAQ